MLLGNLLISLVASTIIIYEINFVADYTGAEYDVFSHGETFIIWILIVILVNNSLKR